MIEQVRAWENELRARGSLVEAEQLRDAVVDPRQADADACWPVMWNKPLYANTRVAIGERHERAFGPLLGDTWRVIGLDPEIFRVVHDGSGARASNFQVQGSLASELRSLTGVAAHRLLAIQGAAEYLRAAVTEFGEEAPLTGLAQKPLADLLPDMRARLGRGWGPITVLHMLTDLGLAVKPDLHLVRAVKHLGLAPDLKAGRVPGEQDAIRINVAVRHLTEAFFNRPATPADLRYMDKLLMECSRQGLIGPLAEAA